MLALGNFSRAAINVSVLAVAGLFLSAFVLADPAKPISECREQSFDQSGFDECLILLVQQSESALDEMESNWLDALATVEQQGPNSGDEVTQSSQVEIAQSPADTEGQVIAIVNEEAIAGASSTIGNLRVINVDDTASLTSASDTKESESGRTLQAEQFASLPGFFRGYRDQRCEWEAGLLRATRAKPYRLACSVALNRQQTLQLRQLLVEKKAADTGGESYRGYYIKTDSGGSFQSCDRRQDWWVTGTEEVLETMQRRYSDIAAEELELVYAELRGRAGRPAEAGPGADFVGSLEVVTLNLMRPILEQDCRVSKSFASATLAETPADLSVDDEFIDADDSASGSLLKTPELTVDDLGDAGFLYGYFSNWISACAVDQLIACQAQTQAEYASEGEWIVSVDRSSKSNWRVRLIPTTENHPISGVLRLGIDGFENMAADLSVTEMEVGRGVTVASGKRARELISQLRAGQSLDFEWTRPDQVGAKASFSLVGITRALQYFNQAEK